MEQRNEVKKEEGTKKKKILSVVGEILLYVMILVSCTMIIPNYVIAKTVVDGESMENTLNNKDVLLMEKVSYRFKDPQRFDVIVFYHFFDKNNQDKKDEDAYEYYVKRVIGLPGETVQIKDGIIYINGEAIEEDFGKNEIEDAGRASQPIKLGDDEYFVLGDNREVSIDSRWEVVGNVKKDWIVGHVCARVYPFDKIGVVSGKVASPSKGSGAFKRAAGICG